RHNEQRSNAAGEEQREFRYKFLTRPSHQRFLGCAPARRCFRVPALSKQPFFRFPTHPLAATVNDRDRTPATPYWPSVAHRGVLPAFKSHSAPRPPQPLRSVLLGASPIKASDHAPGIMPTVSEKPRRRRGGRLSSGRNLSPVGPPEPGEALPRVRPQDRTRQPRITTNPEPPDSR